MLLANGIEPLSNAYSRKSYLGIAVPHSRYTAVPAMAMNVPATHIINDKPTLPDKSRMVLGVAKTPVPMIRLKISSAALKTPS
jgi:hypothetical protein